MQEPVTAEKCLIQFKKKSAGEKLVCDSAFSGEFVLHIPIMRGKMD